MNEYIFYTAEGFTQDPNGNDVENSQMLGIAKGKDKAEALHNLLVDNSWIEEHGFNVCNILCKKVA